MSFRRRPVALAVSALGVTALVGLSHLGTDRSGAEAALRPPAGLVVVAARRNHLA